MLDSFFNTILGWAFTFGDAIGVIIISLILTSFVTLVYRLFTNQEMLRNMKYQLKDYQKQMRELRSQPEKMMEVQKKSMELNMQYLKHTMKPTLYTFIPIIIIFSWLRSTFLNKPDIITWGFKLPLLGWTGLGWLGTYIISSIIISMLLRKIFKIY
ncbi:MAG: EMC3/TMCO1 family protein [Candidatus Woesearchaeota archaeon]|nr:EMC3/TMCO1 family protein [Candidatus Woesearchaeota archaeon]